MAYSEERLRQIFKKTDGRCHICWKRLSFFTYGKPNGWQVEHSNPRTNGGSDRLSNLYPAHAACNLDKGTKTSRTARSWHNKTKAPLSRERKEGIREKNRWGLGAVGAVTGGAIAGPMGAVLGGIFGALAGNQIKPE